MYIVKCINVNTFYTIINYTKTLNLMFFSINIIVKYISSWDTNHDVKKNNDDSCQTFNSTLFTMPVSLMAPNRLWQLSSWNIANKLVSFNTHFYSPKLYIVIL